MFDEKDDNFPSPLSHIPTYKVYRIMLRTYDAKLAIFTTRKKHQTDRLDMVDVEMVEQKQRNQLLFYEVDA